MEGLLNIFNFLKDIFSKETIRNHFFNIEIIEHDKKLFIKSNELMSEDDLKNFINSLGRLRIKGYWFDKKDSFMYFFESTGNEYINKKFNRAINELIKAFEDLQEFTMPLTFTCHNYQNTEEFVLELNTGKGHSDFIKRSKGLQILLNNVLQKYAIYRKLIKKYLYI